ncbi:flagellin [Ectothiorhodospira marina]|uniref:Flagellin n=1 Tax=Ectothiorhodospira marina TaxID=1396821 RepID=A0A1H7R4V1_9GAMM|nr:flagellin [Ectothiorhodospira marina]SEL55152.1 flagellin [Ectothiorhodospira marina]
MSQVINTNIASLNAQRNLNATQGQLQTSLERLSSGLRINSAKDDAAGLAISERFTAQINGLNQAARNANDGISFAQTAEGGLDEIGNLLQRVRQLSVQSANDTNSASDRKTIQGEVRQAIAEIGRIADSTEFNDSGVLNGSLENLVFQVGANQGQTITVGGVDARTDSLGVNKVSGTGSTASAADELGSAVGAVLFSGGTNGLAADDSFTVNGKEFIFKASTSLTDDQRSFDTMDGLINAINETSGDTNVSAIKKDVTEVNLGAYTAGAGSININGTAVALTAGDTASNAIDKVNSVSTTTGVRAEDVNGDIVLKDLSGGAIELGAPAANFGNLANDASGVRFEAGFSLVADIGQSIDIADVTNTPAADVFGITGAATESTLTAVDVSTRSGAAEAITTLDSVLGQVNNLRADLGAVQNRFESTVSNLQVSSENLSASRSRILDADFASETAALTRSQILQQAGTSVLAQANQAPNNVLALLQ